MTLTEASLAVSMLAVWTATDALTRYWIHSTSPSRSGGQEHERT